MDRGSRNVLNRTKNKGTPDDTSAVDAFMDDGKQVFLLIIGKLHVLGGGVSGHGGLLRTGKISKHQRP